jgi:hypothetical protein
MKEIKKFNKFIIINENINDNEIIKNQEFIKKLLLKDHAFSQGDVHQAIMNIIHDQWENNRNYSYIDILHWVSTEFGKLFEFTMMLGKYNYQVENGGHSQYYYNGYASNKNGRRGYYDNIDLHEHFVELFEDLDMVSILEHGKEAYGVITNFTLDLNDDVEQCSQCSGTGQMECEKCNGRGIVECDMCGGGGEIDDETCNDCSGDGEYECDECYGKGELECEDCSGDGEVETGYKSPDLDDWNILDKKWYGISNIVMEEFENYLKTLKLDGEDIKHLIDVSDSIQKFNI